MKKIKALIVQSTTNPNRLSMRGTDGYGTSIRTVLQDTNWVHGDEVTLIKTSDLNTLLGAAQVLANWTVNVNSSRADEAINFEELNEAAHLILKELNEKT